MSFEDFCAKYGVMYVHKWLYIRMCSELAGNTLLFL